MENEVPYFFFFFASFWLYLQLFMHFHLVFAHHISMTKINHDSFAFLYHKLVSKTVLWFPNCLNSIKNCMKRIKQMFYDRSLLSIGNWVLCSEVLLYLHHRNSKLFFHPAKSDNFKDEKISDYVHIKLSQFHKAKTCWTENCRSSGIMSKTWEQFFYLVKKIRK